MEYIAIAYFIMMALLLGLVVGLWFFSWQQKPPFCQRCGLGLGVWHEVL